MLRGRGRYLLMADADGATRAGEVESLLERMRQIEENGHGIVVGSRAHLEAQEKAQRTAFRKLLMQGFHWFVDALCGGHGVHDTQCGFKMFTRATARRIFPVMHIERWAFDVELLFLACQWGDIPIAEVPVDWQEIAGSKLDVLSSTFTMARDLVIIRLCYVLGIWTCVCGFGGNCVPCCSVLSFCWNDRFFRVCSVSVTACNPPRSRRRIGEVSIFQRLSSDINSITQLRYYPISTTFFPHHDHSFTGSAGVTSTGFAFALDARKSSALANDSVPHRVSMDPQSVDRLVEP